MATKRAALYIRVSTEEQALHGYSLDAQKETLTKYALAHDMLIVDYYIDDGYSARKKYTNRKAFMRMLSDVERDKIDVILFIKLDRWFRSVKDYYKIQEILEVHNVGWKTTEENYDTTTTNGRLYINIRLSVAQDESDRTSDRIKFVFDNKVARGEVISGAQPLGLKIENKRLVHDETHKDMVMDLFQFFADNQSKYATIRYVHEKYGVYIEKSTMLSMLKNTLYIGKYRGNADYCEPLIDVELFNKIQKIIAAKGIRQSASGRVYVFSGLCRCASCGRAMSACHTKQSSKDYYYYRCNVASNTHICENTVRMNEKNIESELLAHIKMWLSQHIEKHLATIDNAKKAKPVLDKAKIKRKLSKLKELYINEMITMEEYKTDYELYNAQLEEVPKEMPSESNKEAIKAFLKSDYNEIYKGLERKERQLFWRDLIKEIHVDSEKNMKVFFI